jgi:hypothetical protein
MLCLAVATLGCCGVVAASQPAAVATASAATVCAAVRENQVASLLCAGFNTIISRISFASYGAPSGSCEDGFELDRSCHAGLTKGMVEDECLGERGCEIAADNEVFGDPCYGRGKKIAVVAECSTGEGPPAPMSAAQMEGIARRFHNRTKHHFRRMSPRAAGHIDWNDQPNAFRTYDGAPLVLLPVAHLSQADGRRQRGKEELQEEVAQLRSLPSRFLFSYALADGASAAARPPLALNLQTLSAFLRLSMGLSAWKQSGNSKWTLRSNPSSGALHPTESYVLLPQHLLDQLQKPKDTGLSVAALAGLYHYHPYEHALERRSLLPNGAELAYCEAARGEASDVRAPPPPPLLVGGELAPRPDSCVDDRDDCESMLSFCYDGKHVARFHEVDCCRTCWPSRPLTEAGDEARSSQPPSAQRSAKAGAGRVVVGEGFFVALSSVVVRESFKYGEREYFYALVVVTIFCASQITDGEPGFAAGAFRCEWHFPLFTLQAWD